MELTRYQRSIGIITIISGLLALACMVTGTIAVNYNFDAFSNPLLLLAMPNIDVMAVRWFMILDMFGFYLLLLPVIYLLRDWMKEQSSWYNLITFAGLSYVLVGAIGAAILAVVWPSVINAYPVSTPAAQEILSHQFLIFSDMVYNGLWNLLEMFFAGTWWLCTGILLYKKRFSFIGGLTIMTGVFCFADGIAGIFQLSFLHELALNGYIILAIFWALLTGVFLLKKPLTSWL